MEADVIILILVPYVSSWHRLQVMFCIGSALGPVLLTLHVNELPLLVSSSLIMFVDDTKLYHSIPSPEPFVLGQPLHPVKVVQRFHVICIFGVFVLKLLDSMCGLDVQTNCKLKMPYF